MRARALVEGTALPQAVIAVRLGIGRATLGRWGKARGWTRPPEAPSFLHLRADGGARPVRYRRGRGRPYAADAVGVVRTLVTGTLLSQAAIAQRVGIRQERVSWWMRRHGWVRPPVPPRSTRFAASSRSGRLAAEGDRRGRPYAPEARREARALYELSRLSTALIGSRIGAHRVTVARWAKEERWVRPRGRAGRNQLRGFFGSQRARG